MNSRFEKIFGNVGVAIILLIIAVTLLIVSLVRQNNSITNNQNTNTATSTTLMEPPIKPSEYPDYDYYRSLNNKTELVTSTPSWVQELNNPKAIKGRQYKRFIKSDGNIVSAYLFVDISVDNGKPLRVWDSIYISLRKVVGRYLYFQQDGHLLRSKSLRVPPSNTTQLLYNLSQIPFTNIPYSDDNRYTNKNWLSLIQGAKTFQLETFLSTLSKGGMINNISIGYECAEETPNCKLELINF